MDTQTRPHIWRRIPASDYRYQCERCGELFGSSEVLDDFTVRELSSQCQAPYKPHLSVTRFWPALVISALLWFGIIMLAMKACGEIYYKPFIYTTSCHTYDAVKEVMRIERLRWGAATWMDTYGRNRTVVSRTRGSTSYLVSVGREW